MGREEFIFDDLEYQMVNEAHKASKSPHLTILRFPQSSPLKALHHEYRTLLPSCPSQISLRPCMLDVVYCRLYRELQGRHGVFGQPLDACGGSGYSPCHFPGFWRYPYLQCLQSTWRSFESKPFINWFRLEDWSMSLTLRRVMGLEAWKSWEGVW